MQTQCISDPPTFEAFDGRRVVAGFDRGAMTSDAGSLLLREADQAIGLLERVAARTETDRTSRTTRITTTHTKVREIPDTTHS